LWPPLLVWLWKRKSDVLALTIGIVSISFAANVMLISLWQASDMYFLPTTRFWELLIGSALGYACLYRKQQFQLLLKRGKIVTNVAAATGFFLILIAVASLNDRTLFPGWWALLPTVGASLVICAGPNAWINRNILSTRPFVFIGLISYPLYLWHWPLISFAHIVQSGNPSTLSRLCAVGVAVLLAWLTYLIVEKPLRQRSNRTAYTLITALTITGGLGFAAFLGRLSARSEKYGVEHIIKAATGKWEFP